VKLRWFSTTTAIFRRQNVTESQHSLHIAGQQARTPKKAAIAVRFALLEGCSGPS
jgi:hypothetical protein